MTDEIMPLNIDVRQVTSICLFRSLLVRTIICEDPVFNHWIREKKMSISKTNPKLD